VGDVLTNGFSEESRLRCKPPEAVAITRTCQAQDRPPATRAVLGPGAPGTDWGAGKHAELFYAALRVLKRPGQGRPLNACPLVPRDNERDRVRAPFRNLRLL
jgi:hypothetical protein